MLHSSGGMTISAQHSRPPCPPKTMVSRATAITESSSTALKPAMIVRMPVGHQHAAKFPQQHRGHIDGHIPWTVKLLRLSPVRSKH